MRRLRSDDGSTLPLVAGFVALALAVILTVTAASSLYLERKRLLNVADGAALVGAEAFDLDAVSLDDGVVAPRLDTPDVEHAVLAYLAAEPTTDRAEIELEQAASLDGRSATVTLSSQWTPPVLTFVLPNGVTVRVTSTARSVFR